MYDVFVKLNCDKISIFVPETIDIIASMMYACNGIKYQYSANALIYGLTSCRYGRRSAGRILRTASMQEYKVV